LDRGARLLAEYQSRLAPCDVAEEPGDVQPADARRVDPQERLARLGGGDRDVLDLDFLRTHVDERFHEASFDATPADGGKEKYCRLCRREFERRGGGGGGAAGRAGERG